MLNLSFCSAVIKCTRTYKLNHSTLKRIPLMTAGYSLTLQWDFGLDLWSKERWWPPRLRSSPPDPPLSQRHRSAEKTAETEHSNKMRHTIAFFGRRLLLDSRLECTWSGWNTLRCAATVVRGVLVMRHRSAEPEVGCLALGSNSWPSWWRFNFCCPNPRALRFPLKGQTEPMCVCVCVEISWCTIKACHLVDVFTPDNIIAQSQMPLKTVNGTTWTGTFESNV